MYQPAFNSIVRMEKYSVLYVSCSGYAQVPISKKSRGTVAIRETIVSLTIKCDIPVATV